MNQFIFIYVEHVNDLVDYSIDVIEKDLVNYKVGCKKEELDTEEFWQNIYDNFKVLYEDKSFIIKFEDKYRMYFPDAMPDITIPSEVITKKFDRIITGVSK